MVARVESLPGKDWNAHAVAGDVLERCPIDAEIMAVWCDPRDGRLRYSKTNLRPATIAMMAALMMEFATQRWREWVS